MREYKLCEINFEVGDIVEFKNSESHQPFRVLKITPRVVGDDPELTNLLLTAYDLEVGDTTNPTVDLELLEVGCDPIRLESGLNGWDADYLTKIDIDDINYLIEVKEKRIKKEKARLKIYKKIKTFVKKAL